MTGEPTHLKASQHFPQFCMKATGHLVLVDVTCPSTTAEDTYAKDLQLQVAAALTVRPVARLLLTFAVILSLSSIPSFNQNSSLPSLHTVRANVPAAELWYPAGPAMDTLTYPVFTDESQEFTQLQATPSPIDFTDWPLDQALISSLSGNPNFQVTSAISDTGYFELEFHMGQNWWGCQFNFANAACGTQIRQAFAHGLDKPKFISAEVGGNAQPIDNPVPPSVDLNTPDPCAWDSLFPQTGTGCIVNGAGGTAYHLAAAAAGSGCTNTPQFPYTPGCGTPDFCAAADHLIAAGLASGKNPPTAISNPCVLTGISSAVTTNPAQIEVRSDNTPLLRAGNSYAQFICGLFTASFVTGCGIAPSTNNIFVANPGPFGCAPPPCVGVCSPGTTVALTWWACTAGFGNILTFDSSLFYNYDSQFVSGIPSIVSPSGPCSNKAVPSLAPNNYEYICQAAFDTQIEQAEFSPCQTAPRDPTTGQTHLTVTFANCPGSSKSSAASAAYKAQDLFGQNVNTIPWWSGKSQFAYLTGWQRAVVHKGDGFTPPGNFFLTLNAWNPSPHVAGTVRQGYKQATGSVNPFIGNTVWDLGVIGSIWDRPGITNPDSSQAYLDWMTIKTDQLSAAGLSYVPPTGTVAAFRYTLRSDIFWQTGQKVTAWDLAFSYIAYKASGVGPGLAPMTGIKVLSPTQVDVDVNAVGPFTKLFLSNPVLPGRDWVNTSVCTAATWDAAAGNPNFATANTALTACIAPSSAVTSSGVITPTASNVDNAKIQPNYDPVASHNLIGSGPWMCGSGSSIGGLGCSSSGTQSVPAGGSWMMTRYGVGTTPGGSLNTYFRSAGNLALWAYSGDRGNFGIDFLNFGQVSLCFGKPVATAGCTVWQHGIGGSAAGTTVGLTQVGIVQRFVGVNWVAPYDWTMAPPQNIVGYPPVLHEGAVTLNPCSIDQTNGYDC